jgi:twinkle protein
MTIAVIEKESKREYLIDISKGGENKQTCPACSHERKKSKDKCFSYNATKEVGSCSHCGKAFYKKLDKLENNYQRIEYKRPIWKNETTLSEKLVKWFEGRKISQKTLIKAKVTEGLEWMPQVNGNINTVQFNYFRDGELINVKYRTGNKQFKLAKDAELIFYNLDAVKDQKEIIIVEGEIDCLTLIECGIENVISVPNGATIGRNNLTYLDNCIDLFDEDTRFILALDNDQAGNSLRDEFARRLGVENCSKLAFKDCKDANECLVKYGMDGVLESINNKIEYPLVGIFTSTDLNEEIDNYYNNGLPQGETIGLETFDENLKFHLGYITTITGIPNHGKSEVLDFICASLNIRAGWKFGLFSPENYPLELHFSKFAEKLIGKAFDGNYKMNKMELELAKDYFSKNFFFIKPENDFKLEDILRMVKSLIRKYGVNAFVIDAWNKLEHNEDSTHYVSKQLDILATFCERNMVHCFLVAHPTKIMKDKKTGLFEVPNLYNINGSANFFNKTHNGLTVYRNYDSKKTEIYIQKVKFKHWGQSGTMCSLGWHFINGRYYTFIPDNTNWILGEKKQVEAFELPPTPIKTNGAFDTPINKKDNWDFIPKNEFSDIGNDAF